MSAPGRKVAIVGNGLIGRGWAAAFARAGWRVALWDRQATASQAAADMARDALVHLESAGLLVDAKTAAQLVSVAGEIEEALDGADYVQESVPERAEIKRDVFQMLDRMAAPNILIGSSTSTMPGSEFLGEIPGRHRCMVIHPSNPPYLMPVVEVVPSPWHDDATVSRFCALLESIGQAPVLVQKEIEGFVLNRLQAAVVNEAVALVGNGVIDPEDLDAIMTNGLGLRWALIGPFETMDLNASDGFLDYATRYGALYEAMGRGLTVATPWARSALEKIEQSRRARVPKAAITERMRRRDKALMQLLAMKKKVGLENA
jgi:3-hydroxyacyl-CoA dehydrogenase